VFGLIYIACSAPEISFSVETLDFGTIVFSTDMPNGGYNPLELKITNEGTKDVDISITDFDTAHLCLAGFESFPIELDPISSDSSYSLMVSVCDYIEEDGERDDLLEGAIQIEYGKLSRSIPWSFTPTLDLSDDTGS
jgi:hypothetical protein